MATLENPTAGQNAVVLDIGGDIGALIVAMPPDMVDLEVEIAPTGSAYSGGTAHDHGQHSHSYGDGHGHSHALPHVAVVERPLPDGRVVPSLVFGSVTQGSYDLYVRPDGPIRLTVQVVGGEVTEASWPGV